MLHSMTGFARQTAETGLGTLSCEIRTVNHRYLDLQFRMPDELRPQEAAFRTLAGAHLKRGKVDCSLFFQRAASGDNAMPLNRELVATLAGRISELGDLVPGLGAANALDILRWPGVVEEPPLDVEPLAAAAGELLTSSVAALNEMRASEGERIEAMLLGRCGDIAAIAASMRERMPEVLERVRDKQRERIARLDVEADPARLETELALIAQKLDVDEELDRLESHLSEIRQAIASDEAVGRRLDFLMQELNREANTLGSKSGDTQTTRAAVDLKVLIEQMREQIQNVE